MKFRDIKKIKESDFDKRISELKLELSKEFGVVKMGRATKNPGRIRELRRDVAKILTYKRQLELAEKKSETEKPKKGLK